MPNLDSVTVPCIYHIKSCLHKVVLLPTDLTGSWSVVCLVYAAGVRMEPAMNVLLSAASSFCRSINGLQLRFKVILIPSSTVFGETRILLENSLFPSLAHKYTTTELCLCLYACTILAFLPWKCSMR